MTATVMVVVVAVVAFVLVQNARRSAAVADAATPGGLGPDNSFVVGKASAPVTLVAYEDFQCPICQEFETSMGSRIDTWIANGTVRMEYRPIAILDGNSTDDYSTRSLNAAAAVLDLDPTAFKKFHDLLYANQPAEGGAGLTDAKLVDLAAQAGAPRTAITDAVDHQTYKGWTVRATEAASKAGYQSTPTLLLNGKEVTSSNPDVAAFDPSVLTPAVEKAAAAAR